LWNDKVLFGLTTSRTSSRADGIGVVTKTDMVHQIGQREGLLMSTRDFVGDDLGARDLSATDWLHDLWSLMKERRLKNVPILTQRLCPPAC